jgi:fucose permease
VSLRLNFAQAFNPLGVLSGILIGRWFIFSPTSYTPAQLAASLPSTASRGSRKQQRPNAARISARSARCK